ncbi:heterodisulfide reductase-related iron-sulfur binding cluster [Desulfonatronovibrio hydrogenovorans]|uniref:heterodisulfide reductase-related iron-sulfur binding cluster n=1 Tax=Desulfonatronovibrio hydrogenovorans TaxID=53245 RepID=UPI00048C8D69|nr:heterodisulfide reductase-related iron-sulfur binding cluster [Desulfonatronovibrio hydrogenovorans]
MVRNTGFTPEDLIRSVVDQCTDCEQCREMLDGVCPFFGELYCLFDRERQGKGLISSRDLRSLVDLCNFCGLCPCPDIRSRILSAKSNFIAREGVSVSVKLVQDVERLAGYLTRFPGMGKYLAKAKTGSGILKKMTGIHPERKLPEIPGCDFPAWASEQGLCVEKEGQKKQRSVAFFAGCTARYFFPGVGRAAVRVLQKNRIDVFYLSQKCCSMPVLLEGDFSFALKLMQFNLEHLGQALEKGYDLVTSCPTCGYMFKKILKEKAYYSKEYQEMAGADSQFLMVPETDNCQSWPSQRKYRRLHRSMYAGILKDDGVFSPLPALKRIWIGENVMDMGEYLGMLYRSGRLDTGFSPVPKRIAYFPPCHVREQNIGQPYVELLKMIPELEVQVADGAYLCCGMAGIMGFKKSFHAKSLLMGNPLFLKILEIEPDILVTDCLSCRLQFDQVLPFVQAHPLEIMAEAYKRL